MTLVCVAPPLDVLSIPPKKKVGAFYKKISYIYIIRKEKNFLINLQKTIAIVFFLWYINNVRWREIKKGVEKMKTLKKVIEWLKNNIDTDLKEFYKN